MTNALLGDGVERHEIEGVRVNVFSITRTIADCFRHRRSVGLSIALEGLQEALRQRKATPATMTRQAMKSGVATVVRPYLEALTANAGPKQPEQKNMGAPVRARLLAIAKANGQVSLLTVAMISAMSACASHAPVAPARPVTGAMAADPQEALPQILPSMSLSPEDKMEMHAAGEELYLQRCAMCHDAGRAPPRSQIAQLSQKEIREALDTGFMAAISQFMTPKEQSLLVWHLSEKDVP